MPAGSELLFECVFHAGSSLSCLNGPIIRAFWRDGKLRAAHICARRIGNSGPGGEGMELGIASVAAITAIAYLVGMAVKTTGARLAQHCRCRHHVRLGRDWRAPEREAADKTGAAAPIRRGV